MFQKQNILTPCAVMNLPLVVSYKPLLLQGFNFNAMEEKEIWKDIKGFEEYYQISNFGRVKSLERIVPHSRLGTQPIRERILCQKINSRGYYAVCLSKFDKNYHVQIHQAKAVAFIPNLENKKCINHKDGNRLNNDLPNLEWCTILENNRHSWDVLKRKGLSGAKNPSSKKVVNSITNKIFDCASDAHKEYGRMTVRSFRAAIHEGRVNYSFIKYGSIDKWVTEASGDN